MITYSCTIMLSYKLEVSHHLRDFLGCTIVHIYHKYPKHHLDRPTLKTSKGTQTPVNYQIKKHWEHQQRLVCGYPPKTSLISTTRPF